ncbi:MAG: Smr/MutS family protein [bacterium]|nr:Smr/MutS family protein [bacterium]
MRAGPRQKRTRAVSSAADSDDDGAGPAGIDDRAGQPVEAEPVPLALDGVLDLHMFPPGQARALVDDWLDASRAAGLRDLRIIHGKGIGAMRTLVHAALEARDDVDSYSLAADASSWGATVIRMKS